MEQDFLQHIKSNVAQDPEAGWVFVVDCLNTHMSESLVRFVADQCQLQVELGKKRTCGILLSMESRKAFLCDPSHRIRFVYTPRGASWLNQIELWFSILVRKLLKRASFISVEQLQERIEAFIQYFNAVLAKPFKLTYQGKPLYV